MKVQLQDTGDGSYISVNLLVDDDYPTIISFCWGDGEDQVINLNLEELQDAIKFLNKK